MVGGERGRKVRMGAHSDWRLMSTRRECRGRGRKEERDFGETPKRLACMVWCLTNQVAVPLSPTDKTNSGEQGREGISGMLLFSSKMPCPSIDCVLAGFVSSIYPTPDDERILQSYETDTQRMYHSRRRGLRTKPMRGPNKGGSPPLSVVAWQRLDLHGN